MGAPSQTLVVNWRSFHHEGHFLSSPCSCLWPGNKHERGNTDGHGEVQQRRDVLGAGEHDGVQAGTVQGDGGVWQVCVGQWVGEAHPPSPPCLVTSTTTIPLLNSRTLSTGCSTRPTTEIRSPPFSVETASETLLNMHGTLCSGPGGKLRRDSLRSTRLQSLRSSLRTTTSSRRTLAR